MKKFIYLYDVEEDPIEPPRTGGGTIPPEK